MTNREWLNNLSDEAIASLATGNKCDYCAYFYKCQSGGTCRDGFLAWLKEEHTEINSTSKTKK